MAEGEEQGSKTTPRWRRWLRRVGLGLAGLILLIVALVAAVLWIPPVTAFALDQVLSRWDEDIPGSVDYGQVEGSLAGGLRIEDFALRDGEDRLLVGAGALELELEVAELFTGELRIEQVRIVDGEVHVGANWADLANPDAPEQPPTPGYGPDLPVAVSGRVLAENTRVYGPDPKREGEERLIVAAGETRVQVRGRGREAATEIEMLAIDAAIVDFAAERLAVTARWSDPEARLSRLELDSSLATLRLIEPARYDVAEMSGAFAAVVEGDPRGVADRLGRPELARLDRLALELRTGGDPAAFYASLRAELGAAGILELHGQGAASDDRERIDAALGVQAWLAGGVLDRRQGPLRLRVDSRARLLSAAEAEAEAAPRLVADSQILIHDLRSAQQLWAGGRAELDDLDQGYGRAELGLRGLGLDLEASGERGPDQPGTISWALEGESLRRPMGLAAAILEQPALAQLRGQVDAEGSCTLAEADEPASLRCPVDLRGQALSGFGASIAGLTVNGEVEPLREQPHFEAQLEAREVAAREFDFDRVGVDVHGDPRDLKLTVDAEGPRQSLSTRARLRRDPGKPEQLLAVSIPELDLRIRGHALRLLEPTQIRVEDEAVEIDALRLQAGGGRLAVDGRLAFEPGSRSSLSLRGEAVDLAALSPLIPGPPLAGRAELRAQLLGPGGDFRGWLELHLRELWVGALAVGDVELRAARGDAGQRGPVELPAPASLRAAVLEPEFRGPRPPEPARSEQTLDLWLRVRGPIADRAELALRAPLRLSGGPGIPAGQPYAARLALANVDLTSFGGLMPARPDWWRQPSESAAAPEGDPKLIPEGRVDADLRLAGTPSSPRLSLAVRGRELVLDGVDLGSILVRAQLDGERPGTRVELSYKPRFATRVDLRGELPFELEALGLAAPRTRWRPREELDASVELAALDLDRLADQLGSRIPALGAGLRKADLHGLLSASLRVDGSVEDPHLRAELRGLGLRRDQARIGELWLAGELEGDSLEAELRVDGPVADRVDAQLELPLIRAPGAAPRLDPAGPLRATVELSGLELAGLADFDLPMPVSGGAKAKIQLYGSLDDPRVHADGRVETLGVRARELGELGWHLEFAEDRVLVEADLVREGSHDVLLEAELPIHVELTGEAPKFAWLRRGHHRVLLTARRVDRELLASVLDLPEDVGAWAAFDLRGGGTVQDFRVDGELQGSLTKDEEPAVGVFGRLRLDESRQRLELGILPQSRRTGLEAKVELRVPVLALSEGRHEIEDTPMDVQVHAPGFDLHDLSGMLPIALHDPQGHLDTQLRAQGTIGAPEIEGDLAIREGSLTIVPLRQRLEDIDLKLALRGTELELERLKLRAGRGSLTGEGRAEVRPGEGVDVNIDIDIDEVPLLRPGLPTMTVDSGVAIDIHTEPALRELTIRLSDPEVKVAGSNVSAPKAVPSSRHVIFVTGDDGPKAEEVMGAPADPEVEAGDGDDLRIRLELADPLQISGARVDMAWRGAVEVARINQQLEVGGELEAKRGRLDLLGRSFEIRRGLVTLPEDGEIDPYLDIVAVTQTPEAEVTAKISGRVSEPSLEFSSSPPLDDFEILSLLVTGKTQAGATERGEVQAKAASLLAAVSSPSLQRALDRYLGIDRLSLGFGENIDQPILTVGKRVTEDIYVETSYHHNAPEDENRAELSVEYDFARRWSLETFFGDATVGGVGVYWTRSFPTPAWKPKGPPPGL